MEKEEIQYTEHTFQLIVESSPNAIVLVNQEHKIAYINSQTEKSFGYTKAELMGQTIEQLIPEHYSKKYPEFHDMFFKLSAVRYIGVGKELLALRKDHTEFPIEIELSPIVTVDGTLVLASIIDITERKKAEEQFRFIIEAPNAMVLVNNEGFITLINNQTEKLFGYERNELVGNKLEILIPERFRNQHVDHRNMFFKKQEMSSMGAGGDQFAMRKNGIEIQVEIGLTQIETAEGRMVLASIIDITERKIQEATLKKQNKKLAQFAYIASHDLQEPLRTVSNYMHVFEENYLELLDDNARKYLRSVDNATKRMSILIRLLLDFSELDLNKKLIYVDCKKIINDVIADLDIMIKTSNTIIEITEMPKLNVYETGIRQLFQNLITNAIKFRKKDIQPKIKISSEKINEQWIFSVSDNGIGIAPVHFERIFDIFQRLNTNEEYEGNGIGLANCKKIVQLHQGEIWVESTIGEGTTFHFTISNLTG